MNKNNQPLYDSGDRPPPNLQYGDPYGDPYYGTQPPGGGLTPLRLLRLALRKWKTIVLATVLSVLLGFLYLYRAVPQYRAQATLEMTVRRPRVVKQTAMVDDGTQHGWDIERLFNTRLAKFRSPALIDRAVEMYRAVYPREQWEDEGLAWALSKQSSWTMDRKAFLVTVTVEGPDPEFTAQAANVLGAAAMALMQDENQGASDQAVAWLEAQAAEQRADLGQADQELVDYRKLAQLDARNNRKQVLEMTLLALNDEKVRLENEQAEMTTVGAFLEDLRSGEASLETLPEGLPDAEQLRERLTTWWAAKLALEEANDRYTEIHPQHREAVQRHAGTKSRLDTYLTTIQAMIVNRVKLIGDQIRQTDIRTTRANDEMVDLELEIVKADAELQALTRERDAADVAYRGILHRIEEARLAADENTAMLKVMNDAEVPLAPFKPIRNRILALALFLGLAAGAGLAFLLDLWEDRITSNEDVEQVLGMELLGLLPSVKKGQRKDLALKSLNEKFSEFAESVAGVRAVMDSDRYRDRCRGILVTSTSPEVGKTVLACNLAIASARSGLSTLLIDFDLRRARVGDLFDLPGEGPSLLHFLANGVHSDGHLAQETECKGLHVIRTRYGNEISPSEVISGPKTRAVLDWALEKYDRVIVDSPPFGLVGDAAVLAGYVTGVIMVCRPSKSRRRHLRHAIRHFENLGADILGAVVNDVDFSRSGHYSGSYYSQYGYKDYHAYKSYQQPEPEKAAHD